MKRLFFAAAISAVLSLMASNAMAGLVVASGNNPQTDDNVIANGCSAGAAVPGPALTVKGCFDTNHGQPVDFTSNEVIKYTGGQAAITASDGAFATLTISVEGATFDALVLNIDAIKQKPSDLTSKVSFTDGITTSALFELNPNGQNFFTLTGDPFNFITLNVFNAAQTTTALQDVADVKQVRIGGVEKIPDPVSTADAVSEPGTLAPLADALAEPDTFAPLADAVPEPGTLALLGAGLVGLGFVRQRRKTG